MAWPESGVMVYGLGLAPYGKVWVPEGEIDPPAPAVARMENWEVGE